MDIKVDASQIESFHHRFSKVENEFPKRLETTIRDATRELKKNVPPYPPPPPHSTYKRTGRTGKSIGALVEPLGTRVVGHLYSRGVPYAPYVIDEKKQARIHRGRWWTLQEVLSGFMPTVVRRLSDMWNKLYRETK